MAVVLLINILLDDILDEVSCIQNKYPDNNLEFIHGQNENPGVDMR